MKISKEQMKLIKLQRTGIQSEKDFERSIEIDYATIEPEIRGMKLNSVLDIGCGIAGIDLKFNCPIFLIDKTQVDADLYYGFHPKTSFYNSLIEARYFLANNGQQNTIILQEATEDNKILFNGPFSLVISLISCGFHYPIDTYMDQVYDRLENGGKFIVDIRRNTDGLLKLQNKFQSVKIIQQTKKYLRVCATKHL